MSHPVAGDCMIVDMSSPLCDDVKRTPTPGMMVQGNTGDGRGTGDTCGTVIGSLQVDPKIQLWLTILSHRRGVLA